MLSVSDVLPVIPKIYDCILDPGGLAELGEALVRLAGGHTGALVSYRPDRSYFWSDMSYNVDPSAQEAYLKRFDRISPFHSLEKLAQPGQIVTASELIVSDEYQKSVFYNEFAKKRDHWDYLGIMISKGTGTMAGYAIMRPHKRGLITPLEIERMKLIAPHLQRAFLVRDFLNEQKMQVDVMEKAIAGAGFGLVLATATGWIAYANCAAESLLRTRRGLQSEHGRISATESKAAQKLQALISAASHATGDALPGGSLLIPDEEGTASLVLHIVPITPSSSTILLSKEQSFAGIFIVDRRSGTNDRVKNFAALFRLTPGETRVLAELISGEGIARVSDRLKITELTARTHLKHITAKTDTHRQAELVKLFFETTFPRKGNGARQSTYGWRDAPSVELTRS